ncbi:sulfatase family protein [Tichowtungia aerotolerans]|uniref:Sulfatase-like hydrolase/transferase n=1 Tax=Tichowtungia aerotolerans TaxID=2697043 RepID=A0A6P1M5W9_9BACT|nr:sulfatase [Tichowtungia aerotolerans]QHI68004.1 sulfatase-like hydrolase/transferase [Tichowtungia aerotolerans]
MKIRTSRKAPISYAIHTALLTGMLSTFAESAAPRPNILFIFTDDQRWDALGVVQEEMGKRARFPWLKTPNLDRLAAQGMRFREAFVVNSVCSPSRACMLTGQYSHNNGLLNNHTPFPVETVTVPKLLQQAGYTTGMFGKWHMGAQQDRPGFDVSKSYIGHGQFLDCPFLVNGVKTPTQGWVDDVATDYAIDFIKKNSNAPFFAWVGLKSPHDTRVPAPQDRDAYQNEYPDDSPNLNRHPMPFMNALQAARGAERDPKYLMDYFRTLNGVDRCIGRILDALEATGQRDNTLLVFSSDNGYYLGEHCKTDKRMAHEESLRIPLLIHYPDMVPAGSLCDATVLNIDLSSTFLDLAGVSPPSSMQGASLTPLLQGNTPASWRTAFFYEYFYENNTWPPTVTAVRTTTHKLIKYHFAEPFYELFDLQNDPYETRNLFYEPKFAPLKKRMLANYQQQHDACGYFEPEAADRPTRVWPNHL